VARLPLLLAVCALVLSACTSGSEAAECEERLPGVRPGLCLTPTDDRGAAPTEAGPVLGEDGVEASLTDLRGQPVVVNFWGSWCGPCRTEQPELNDVAEQFDGEVAFLGVNVTDPVPNATAYQREFDVPYESIHDPAGSFAARFGGIGPSVMPSTLLIDAEGRVAARIFGSTTGTELTVLKDRLLADG
jgi:thiol-disulfide isomerase/thioredoxin